MKQKIEEKILEVYQYIQRFLEENGFPPSVREIGAACQIKSTSTVHYYLSKLKEMGYIQYAANQKRAVSIASNKETTYIPLIGDVSAGQGMLAIENVEGEYPLPKDLFNENNLFMLRVDGDSMIDAGIQNGDFVIVHQQNSANVGEIVVALWQEKATIKRLVATTPSVILHPENDTMHDIVLEPKDEPSIIGKVVGCIKRF